MILAAALSVLLAGASRDANAQAQQLYEAHCASCHGADRLGAMGPALLPENLERLKRAEAEAVIRHGRTATRMPGFEAQLTPEAVRTLVDFIYSARPMPTWDTARIEASRVLHPAYFTHEAAPVYDADPRQLFVVVEAGDHHVTILDGERFEPLARFPSRYALHGGAKFSPDGRYTYLASRDGWVSKYDLWRLSMVAEVRAGINTRNIAVSADGQWLAVGNYLPHTLVILRASDLSVEKILPVSSAQGKSSRVSAVYDAAPRKSFVVALKDVPELWELSYDPQAPAFYEGLVHDYRLQEGIATPAFLAPRRTLLNAILDDFFFAPGHAHLIGSERAATGARGQIIHLDVRRQVASVDLPGLPHLGSGIHWQQGGRTLLATPNLARAVVSVIDAVQWKIVAEIPTLGPGFFMRSHERTPYAWVDAFNSEHRDTLQIIDKRTLQVVKHLRPEPGKTLAHVEFTRDGRYALASLWEQDGALIIYDADTLQEVKRVPMRKPVGKYRVPATPMR